MPEWHWTQSPFAGCVPSATLNVLAAATGRVWKPVYWAPFVRTVGEIGYLLTSSQTSLFSWQFWQPDVMPVWIIAVVGAGVANALPGTEAVALPGTRPAGVEGRWQVSHAVPDGMCEFGPVGEVAGITTIFEMP